MTHATTQEATRTALRIHNSRLIDGTGSSPVDDAVVIVDAKGTITYAGAAATAPPAADDVSSVRVIDAGGRTVLPGFFDCHVHLAYAHGSPPGRRAELDPVLVTLDTTTRLRQTLDAGITTARDLGGLSAGYRTAVETGRIVGPRLHTAVRILSHTGGHADLRLPDGIDLTAGMTEIADTSDAARLAARRVLRDGADLVKVCATGGMGSPYDDPDDEGLLEEEIRAVVDEARRHGGKPVAAHAQGNAGILNAIRGGVTSIEHGYGLDERALDMAGERGVFVVPTLSTVYAGINKDTMPDYHYQKKIRWSGITKENIARGIEYGARIVLGTDAAVGPHGVNLMELSYLVDLGMDPMAAIVAGTRTSAELLGVADRLGTLAADRTADLVICDGDPLADIGILGDPAHIVCVVQDGIVRKDLLLPAAPTGRQS
ncbi:amidohydrolase family protein [Streptomyces sp. NBC_01340]|uniref:metal-dependent hydrolase family protein n=1 Tax=unclassified Streptomyces TaxID=2593676 RepID=UPI00225259D8|nr:MULTISPECIES: amidohydrolase family protein [unclassified Streptomyces]MCX4458236.1 amidohydrolase family protein [Streptomyces sp. NBC_01719]MCX4497593.1 amidohydrolase family protein [Streptomyces sp. NBC_01728]WSI42419.1 amidohydrolase family protein [Streptomyces sp. NBC_01340]